MLIVDKALEQRASAGNPIRVALIGAGFMARGIVNQLVHAVPGMELVAIVARRLEQAEGALRYAGIEEMARPDSVRALQQAMECHKISITADHSLVCQAESIDAIIEVTGSIHYAARVVLDAMAGGKHVIMMNAELDGTVGPLLQQLARKEGVVLTACDGDQPGVQANLLRFVRSIGCRPLVAGNIKGLQDPYRNPTTQKGFAEKWGQNVHMVTSFADGTKISFEQAIVANAFGLTVPKRGMLGNTWTGHIDGATSLYRLDELLALGGIVDYVVGALPSPGVYVFASHDDPRQQHYLNLYKLGTGPLYSFYVPYHLCHFEVPLSVARAVLFKDAVLQPAGPPRVDVVTVAKTDLPAGTRLDGIGGYHCYGEAERSEVAQRDRLLPMGLAEDCVLIRPVKKDQVIAYADVEVPAGRLGDELRARQDAWFGG